MTKYRRLAKPFPFPLGRRCLDAIYHELGTHAAKKLLLDIEFNCNDGGVEGT